MEDILIINRKVNEKAFEFGSVWKTCRRQVFIGKVEDLNTIEQLESDQILINEMALKYLIEVLCGLHSPIIGETEVFGQFKIFIDKQREISIEFFDGNQKWLSFVLTEVKKTRSQHLVGVGAHSYGSLIRKLTKNHSRITILGAGQLASEILPWVSCKESITAISRNPEKLIPYQDKIPQLKLSTYQGSEELAESLVIAASVPDQNILDLIHKYGSNTSVIYDLRGEKNELKSQLQNINNTIQIISLDEFFSAMEDNKKELSEKLLKIQKILQEKCLEFINRIELRPHGWDDICA